MSSLSSPPPSLPLLLRFPFPSYISLLGYITLSITNLFEYE
jgi:hypothetical protein